MEIKEEMTLQMKNVLSYRGKMDEATNLKKKDEIFNLITEFGAHMVHPPVQTVFGAEQTEKGTLLDMEILVPLDKDVSHEVLIRQRQLPGYRFKPEFLLTNAVRLHHTGEDSSIEQSIKELYSYIKTRNLHPITSLYNCTLNDPDDPNKLIVDLIIGIDPNKL